MVLIFTTKKKELEKSNEPALKAHSRGLDFRLNHSNQTNRSLVNLVNSPSIVSQLNSSFSNKKANNQQKCLQLPQEQEIGQKFAYEPNQSLDMKQINQFEQLIVQQENRQNQINFSESKSLMDLLQNSSSSLIGHQENAPVLNHDNLFDDNIMDSFN